MNDTVICSIYIVVRLHSAGDEFVHDVKADQSGNGMEGRKGRKEQKPRKGKGRHKGN